MAFELTIDGREPASIFDAFKESAITFIRSDLPCGDFKISNEGRTAVVIERKTWSDLVASLTSGRLGDQAARIIEGCREVGARPVLLIEHAEVVGWGGNSGGASNKFIACAVARFALEGFSVVRTRNISDTRDFVLWTLERCNNGKIPMFTPEFVFEAGKERKFKKKAYGKPWEVMLTAVRGISKAKAKKLSEKFTNAKALLSALEADGDVVKRVGVDGVGKKLCADMREAFIGS